MAALATTFRLLAKTDNESAVNVLVAGLNSSQREVREQALTAILDRQSPTTELLLLRRWPELSERWKQQIAERPGWLSRAIRAAIVNRERSLFEIACTAAVVTRDYEAIPYLVSSAVDPMNILATSAATATLELAEQLADEIVSPRDYRSRRDPKVQRDHAIVALEQATEHTGYSQVKVLIEVLLLVAKRDTAALVRVLQSAADRAHNHVVETLLTSTRPAIESLLLSYLDQPQAPQAAIGILARRADLGFIRRLMRKLAGGATYVEKTNLQRITAIPWLRDHLSVLDGLHDNEQPGALHLAVESAIPREQALDVLAYLARYGKLPARRLAAEVLNQFRGPVAAKLTVELMDDDDPQVRAAAARQLRERNIPGAIQRLTGLLDSSHAEEREAALGSLQEFTFEHFASNFEQLDAAARLSSGALVRRVDPHAVEKIRSELAAISRGRKQRAIELALALGAVEELHGQIAAFLAGEDQFLRIEAIRALATCDSRATRDALRDSLLDSHPLVREAAEAALAELTSRETVKLAADSRRDTVRIAPPQSAPVGAPPVVVVNNTIQAAIEVSP